jgi:hypothetical protein
LYTQHNFQCININIYSYMTYFLTMLTKWKPIKSVQINVYWTKKIGNGAETTITKSDATKYQGQTVQAPGLIILNTDFNDIIYEIYHDRTKKGDVLIQMTV